MRVSMVLRLRIESIPILRCNVSWVQYWMRIPAFSVPISSVLLESASFGLNFASLGVFGSFAMSRI
jgi:hypothetical protein